MFVYCSDTALAAHASNENLFGSLDSKLDSQQRLKNYALFLDQLQSFDPYLLEIWTRDFIGYVRQSCDWLAQLVNGNGNS